jgi:hypothetical protein
VKISSSWGTGKNARNRKRTVLRTKIRWDRLGLQDPDDMSPAPSMEYIRSQIISMANQGLEASARLRADAKDGPLQSVTSKTVSTNKRRRSATNTK